MGAKWGQLVGSQQRQLKQQVLSKCAAIRVPPQLPSLCSLLLPACAAFAFLVLFGFATLTFRFVRFAFLADKLCKC